MQPQTMQTTNNAVNPTPSVPQSTPGNTNVNPDEEVNYDSLLIAAGGFGSYQIYLLLSTAPFYFFGAFSYFSQIFMTEYSTDFFCKIPELQSMSVTERKHLAIPKDSSSDGGYAQCKSYKTDWQNVINAKTKDPDSTWKIVSCEHGYEFEDQPYPTIVTEYGWVCSKSSYAPTAQALFFLGSIFGGILIGWIADRYGRLHAIVSSNVIGCVAGILTVFSTNFPSFAFFRFLMGMSYDNCMIMAYLLVLEFVVPKYRALIANLPFAVFFTIGLCILPWLSLLCGHWKTISLVTSIPMGASVLAYWLLPESPRWLISRKRFDDAVKKALDIAKSHRKTIPPDLIARFHIAAANEEFQKESFVKLLRIPCLRWMFIYSSIIFTCSMVILDLLVRAMDNLEFDFFVSFTLVNLAEFPSMIVLAFALNWTGRKLMTFVGFVVCIAISLLLCIISDGWPAVLFGVISRFFINMSLNAAMQWNAEVLPTSVRGVGVSIIHICGYVGSMLSPYIAFLGTFKVWIPFFVMAIVSTVGAVFTLLIPETTDIDMAQSFHDAEKLMKQKVFYDCPYKVKKRRRQQASSTN